MARGGSEVCPESNLGANVQNGVLKNVQRQSSLKSRLKTEVVSRRSRRGEFLSRLSIMAEYRGIGRDINAPSSEILWWCAIAPSLTSVLFPLCWLWGRRSCRRWCGVRYLANASIDYVQTGRPRCVSRSAADVIIAELAERNYAMWRRLSKRPPQVEVVPSYSWCRAEAVATNRSTFGTEDLPAPLRRRQDWLGAMGIVWVTLPRGGHSSFGREIERLLEATDAGHDVRYP